MNISTPSFTVIRMTDDPVKAVAEAAMTCYQTKSRGDKHDRDLIAMLMSKGHESMFEFADITVKFSGCSIAMIRELDRHRHASFAQESTRYVDESNLNVVPPPEQDKIGDINKIFIECENNYCSLRESGMPKEDARQVLPLATTCETVMKANIREWRYILELRCSKDAHWEIRGVMVRLLLTFKSMLPEFFSDFNISKDGSHAFKIVSETKLKKLIRDFVSVKGVDSLNNLIGGLNG